MKNLILFALCFGTALAYGKGAPSTGLVEVRHGRKIYVEHYPAAPDRPTLFVANGLTFSTRDYHALANALRELDPGVGIVLFDMVGMGDTLLIDPPVKNRIPIEEQIRDVRDLLHALKINGHVSLAGLSYGGAIALKYSTVFPTDFDAYIALAPMLERLPQQDMWIRNMTTWHMMYGAFLPTNANYFYSTLLKTTVENMVSWHLLTYPGAKERREELIERYQGLLKSADWWQELNRNSYMPDPTSYEQVYDYYLRILIYTTYWIPEPSVLENPYKLEGVFRMVQGVKDWNAMEAAKLFPKGKIHALAAVQDEHVKIDRMDAFWDHVPREARASYLRLNYTRHKISTEWPKVTAVWLLNILNKNPELNRGYTFSGDPIDKEAVHGSIRIPLNKVGQCESLLGKVSE